MKAGYGQQGWSQQTPAVQTLLSQAFGTVKRAGTKKRRKKATSTRSRKRSASSRKRASSSRKKPARLVKGSAAAKRYMASIRKKRRK